MIQLFGTSSTFSISFSLTLIQTQPKITRKKDPFSYSFLKLIEIVTETKWKPKTKNQSKTKDDMNTILPKQSNIHKIYLGTWIYKTVFIWSALSSEVAICFTKTWPPERCPSLRSSIKFFNFWGRSFSTISCFGRGWCSYTA